ncbi:MAG: biosynthetic-type acetolactate synthase large subunit [Candidatus Marinimicrobia bacterium]|nr:biosynthetic-type acetolactate synthase large subunit [Candidatus Neomarinimicrobiota bacterium]
MKGSKILLESLLKEDVDTIFGYPGGSVIPILDEFYNTNKIKFLLTRHEQGAAHAADGYARVTQKVGVCIVTSGPGATNTITGIANAKLDSIPIVVISGQVPSGNLGTDAFQETDMVGLTRSISKHNYLIKEAKDIPKIINEAFYIAKSGRPGPVTVDIPVDLMMQEVKKVVYPTKTKLLGYNPNIKGNPKQIDKLVNAIGKSKKPLLYIGGGVIISKAEKELQELMKKTNIPTVSTMMGLGSIPYNSVNYLGMPGMHGVVSANLAISECDLLIAVGVRFDDRITGSRDTFARDAEVAHIDIDPAEIGKNIFADIPIVGDAKNILKELNSKLTSRKKDDWNKKTNNWKKENPLKYDQKNSKGILPQFVIDKVNEFASADTIIATDVGQHQMWSAQFYHHKKPNRYLTSGGLGTMGYGLPAAMGAAYGFPKKEVILFTGDGSIQMNIQELATLALNKINVKIIILNNSFLGMVRQWQDLFWDKNYSATCLRRNSECKAQCKGPENDDDCPNLYLPDFVKVAEANGVKGLRTDKVKDVGKILKEGLEYDGPVLMEFLVEKEENVYPMVPAGKMNNEILFGD